MYAIAERRDITPDSPTVNSVRIDRWEGRLNYQS